MSRFAELLSDAIDTQPLTLEPLSAHLGRLGTPVTQASLSYWRSGRSVPTRAPSLRAVEHLEKLLMVAPGHLVSALPGDGTGIWKPTKVLPRHPDLGRTLGSWGCTLDRRVTTELLHDAVVVRDEVIERRSRGHLVRSLEDGIDSVPVVLALPHGAAAAVTPVVGCRVRNATVLPPTQDAPAVLVADLAPAAPLARGELALLEYRVDLDGAIATGFSCPLPSTARHLVLEASFVGQEPLRVAHQQRERTGCRALDVAAGGAQLALEDAPAGVHRLSWSWSPQLAVA